MALLDAAEAPSHTVTGVPAPQLRRPPPRAICILLPVWGADFIAKFFEQSLPTLLAPGNVPALANALPTRFVFLTRARDEASFRAQAGCRRLEELVNVEFLPIDDLITRSNHSTTVTLAYARAVRQAGEAMLDTCFFFLVSDYIMADGSLAAVLGRMQAGASAVQAGNFQLDEEAGEPWLLNRLASADGVLALEPREVMRWALGCLHPITAANILNYPVCHNTHTNRLLWHVDDATMIGRFYLLHMICVRPEIVDFVVGASCDYSFVPEMCPSDNVEVMTDSDDYLVVEIQPSSHEAGFLRLGAMSTQALAAHLSEWTTARHRANAEQTILFHADAPPAGLSEARDAMDARLAQVRTLMAPKPQPHRNHPYWLGAIAAFDAATTQRDAGAAEIPKQRILRAFRRLQQIFFGRTPNVTRLHPRWHDYKLAVAAAKEIATGSSRVLIGASRSTPLTDWLGRRVPTHTPLSPYRLVRQPSRRTIVVGDFDAAFIELLDNEIANIDLILRRVTPLLRPGAQIFIASLNRNWFADPQNFGMLFASGLGPLACLGLWPEQFYIASSSRWRWSINDVAIRAAARVYQHPTVLLPIHLAATAIMFPLMALANLASSRFQNLSARNRIASSVFIRLRFGAPDITPPPAQPEPDAAKAVRAA
ncbi:MAG: hypothetical protein JO258_00175 [Alphaproteobacteria bacterium]|nr:hypothetical protein [Alphaproteobacteria bacterium]